MNGLLRWFVGWVGPGALLQITLLVFFLWFVAFGLVSVVQSLDISLLTWTTIVGVLIAWLAARSKVKGVWAVILLVGSGLGFVLLFQGQIGGPLAVLVIRFAQFLFSVERWLLVKNAPSADPTLLSLAAGDLQNQVTSLNSHFSAWLASLVAGRNAFDALVNSIMWGLLLWTVSSWAAWNIRRHERVLLAFVPATALLAGVLNFARTNPYILIPVIVITFILIIILEHQKRERRWDREKIDYTTEIRLDIAFAAIPVMLAVIGMASLAPSISIGKAVELARRIFEKQTVQVEKVGQSLGLKQEAGSGYFSRQQTGSTLPQMHLLGSGSELSKHIIMEVKVTSNSSQSKPGEAYYWRSLTYDQYSGAGWISSGTRVLEYKAGDQVVSSSMPDHRLVLQEVHFVQTSGGPLYHTGELVSVDQDYQAAWRLPLETGPDLFGATIAKDDYMVKSLLPLVSQEELRLAGTDYPDWVKGRYLELPPSVPGRVLDLARELTTNQPSPYDEAYAIQNFLRTYTYTLDLPAPPAYRDVADYFLFDLKKGYCDYYATAMVVLARAAGIPARFVTGYASGEFDSDQNHYTVTEADAHSWPEVYFPQYGWVEFEPTAGRPAILLPERLPPPEKPAVSGKLPVIGWLMQLKLRDSLNGGYGFPGYHLNRYWLASWQCLEAAFTTPGSGGCRYL